MRLISLLSGGLDSVTAFYHAHQKHELQMAVSFDYGAKHNAKEIPCARFHASKLQIPHEVITLNFMLKHFKSDLLQTGGSIPQGNYSDENMKSTVVPFRNGIMLSIVAGIAESLGADGIVIASHAGDHAIYPDCRPDFTQAMSKAITLGTYNGVQVIAPFIHKTKAEIVKLGLSLGIDYAHTWSCYCGGDLHCGKCGTCTERIEAFAEAHCPDPVAYRSR